MALKEIDDKEISQKICDSELQNLRIILLLKKKLSETVTSVLASGHNQNYVSKLLEVGQPKVSILKNNIEQSCLSETKCIKYLKMLGVYTITDSGQEYFKKSVKFYTNEDIEKRKLVKNIKNRKNKARRKVKFSKLAIPSNHKPTC